MTVEDVFAKIRQNMIKGLMLHDELANYYDFLGLKGYKRCHEYHYFKESGCYREINKFFINYYNKLIAELPVEEPKIISEAWSRHKRMDVDNGTKKTAVKNGLKMWLDWETETKKLYIEMRRELIAVNEMVAACKVQELICEVSEELKSIERYCIEKKAIDYDLSVIMAEQQCKHDMYKKKIKKLKLD